MVSSKCQHSTLGPACAVQVVTTWTWPGTSQEGDIPLLNTEISQHQPTIFFISMLGQYRHFLLGHSD